MGSTYHEPVMANEVADILVTDIAGTYVDATYGGGGHSAILLSRLAGGAKLFALDQDRDALEQVIDDPRLELINGNFRFLRHFLYYRNVLAVDGILADLGVSSAQLDNEEKGFSFSGGPLDMRMNQKAVRSAVDIVNKETEQSLVDVFSRYGEVRNAKSLARAIVASRDQKPISNTHELLHCVEPLILGNRRRYLAQVFQAIRIKVNNEIEALEDFLVAGAALLVPGGKFLVLTYHSIEDRVVKHFFKSGTIPSGRNLNYTPCLRPLNKKPLMASEKEIRNNNRARSCKLRVAIKY